MSLHPTAPGCVIRTLPTRLLFSFWLAAIFALVSFAQTPDPAFPIASPEHLGELSGEWKTQAGDDPAWANPAFDDSGWHSVPLSATWIEQGYEGTAGYLWYRKVILPPFTPGPLEKNVPLGILLGPVPYGFYELYVNGQLAGRYGSPSLRVPIPSARVFPLPGNAVPSGKPLVLALRVWRAEVESDHLGRFAGPTLGVILLGPEQALRDRLELYDNRSLLRNLPDLIFSFLFLVVGAYHLHLYRRRRSQQENFWFGCLSIAFAVNTYVTSSDWISLLTIRQGLVFRLQEASGHIIVIASIQFLWPLLSRPIGRWLRAYQLSHVALAGLAFALHYTWIMRTQAWLWLWLLPLLLAVVVVIAQEAWRGNPDARTIGLGGLTLVAAELYVLLQEVWGLPWTPSVPLPMVGFTALIFSMALSLSNRFSRVHSELDELSKELEQKVEERTAELQQAQQQNELLLTSAGEGIFGLDTEGNTIFINPAAEKMLGWNTEELLGKPFLARLHATGLDGSPYSPGQSPVEVTIQTGDPAGVRGGTFQHKDGTCFPVEYTSTPLHQEKGRRTGAVVIFRDITERRELDQAKDEFISVVSHELRTPLTSIRGALGLLGSDTVGKLPPKGKRMIEIAVNNTERLTRLINDILDLERINAGKFQLRKEACDAATLVEDAVNVVQAMAMAAEVTLQTSSVNAPLRVDPDRIVQTLTNLLGNAIKFSPPGGVVRLSARRKDNEIIFCITDQGRGIPPAKLEAIFDRFQQVDASDTRKQGGSGLGLTIARNMIQQHGGRIWVESDLGQGSTFYFTLPLNERAALISPKKLTR